MQSFRWLRVVLGVALALAALGVFWFAAQTAAAAPPVQELKGDPGRGAYVFAAAAGCGCHITEAGFLAGGTKYEGPFGTVHSKNLTSDPETGLGNWTEAEIVTAFRTGKTKDGEQLFPIMPYHTFSGMADQDAYDLAAFIKTAPPIKNALPEDKLNFPVPAFNPPPAPATAPTEGLERGKYLVNNVSDCGGCHTPTDAQGNPDMSKILAGAPVEGELSANITPDEATGIGKWTAEQIANLLKTGQKPDGSSVKGLMMLVVQGGFSKLTDADRLAIANYIKTVPAVNNVPQLPAPLPSTGMALSREQTLFGSVLLGSLLLIGGALTLRGARRRR